MTRKSFFHGGITSKQFIALINAAVKRENRQVVFYAKIHGAKIKGEKLWGDGNDRVVDTREIYNGDPESVKHLSQEERERMTRELMDKFKSTMPMLGKNNG